MKHKFKNVLMLILTILSLTFSALGFTLAFAAGTWLTVGTAGFSAGQAYYTSLAFDNGTPYVAYRDDGNSYKATVMKFDGANWVPVGSVGFSTGAVSYTSLALDDGTPYVAYSDGDNSNKATVMKFDGANWVAVGSAGFSAAMATYISLAFDNGTPYVAYMDGGNSNKATVMKFNGANWVPVGSAGFSAAVATYISLAFDNGTPYVAYSDQVNSYKATVMKFDGTNWVAVGSAGFSAGKADYTSVALDNGTPYVAYRDNSNSFKATVMKFDGANWAVVGSAGFSADDVDFTSVALDNGTPYVAYVDWGNSNKATVMKFDGSNWVPLGSAGFSASEVSHTSLVFDNGTPYVAYSDWWVNSKKATVMKFADITAPTVDSFAVTSPSNSLNIPITAFSSSDNLAVTGYLITESATPPTVGDSGWTASAPTTYPVASMGSYTLYPWAKDAAGNVSAVYGSPASVTVCGSLSTITVANTNDSGPGSLRQALADACSGITVDFNASLSGQTITLTSNQLEILKNLTIDGSDLDPKITISGNNSTRVFYVGSGVTATLDSLIVTQGRAVGNGSGLLNDGTLTITNSLFSANTGDNYVGGGIMNSASGMLTITDSTISGNSDSNGGGIGNYNQMTITSSTLSANTSGDAGGGIFNEGAAATLTVTNSTFSGNTASTNGFGSGGGIFSSGPLTVRNSTFSGNSAAFDAGGISQDSGTLNFANTIIANSSGGDCHSQSALGTHTNNLVEDGSCAAALSDDPNLGALASNGGATQTFALLANSPAIDAGDDATCTTSPVSNLDQRGTVRPNGGHCDIGAYEYVDITAPSVMVFNVPASPTTLNIPITTFTVSEDAILTGYLITESATPPTLGDPGWTASAPTTYPVASIGSYTLYPWAKDAAGHVSAVYGSGVTANITCLTPLTVMNANDTGIGSLRQAIADACVGDLNNISMIDFDSALSGSTIHLSSQLTIAKNVTIDGSSLTSPITLSGDNNVRVFSITGGAPGLTVTLDSLIVTKGAASGHGAGLYMEQGMHVTIQNSTFSDNHAGGRGGGIGNQGALTLINSTIDNNTAVDGGGGISNESGMTMLNSTISNNSATGATVSGGGLFNTGGATITNSTIFGNSSNVYGGGISTTANLTITNSTIAGNSAYATGGLQIDGNVTHLRNTIIANNTSTFINSLIHNDCSDTTDFNQLPPPTPGNDTDGILTNINNLIEDGSCSPFLNGDPKLGPLANNGGFTQTMALLAGSKAIDAGDDTTCAITAGFPNYGPGGLDQRGVTRLQGSHCDIGAFEYPHANIDVIIGGSHQKTYSVPLQGSQVDSYFLSNGPVEVKSTNSVPVIAAERVIFAVNGTSTSYSELMGLPKTQVATSYLFPWYNNQQLNSQLRFGNVGTSSTVVSVKIHGVTQATTYTLAPGESTTATFPVSDGPVEVFSDGQNIIAAERVIFAVNNTATSYSEMMGLPKTQVATSYLFPWYNNQQLNSQLRFGNVGSASTIVSVKIHGITQATTYTLAPGESTTATFPVSDGPVEVFSDGQNIIAAERVIFAVNNTSTSYSELMGLPKTQAATSYLFPWYNNQQLNSQLRFGNVGTSSTVVSVKIHGVTQAATYTLAPGESTTATFAASDGPIEVFSDGQNIIAAERVIFAVNNAGTSYSELMGLPKTQMSTSYLFPWYNNLQLNAQLRFGAP